MISLLYVISITEQIHASSSAVSLNRLLGQINFYNTILSKMKKIKNNVQINNQIKNTFLNDFGFSLLVYILIGLVVNVYPIRYCKKINNPPKPNNTISIYNWYL